MHSGFRVHGAFLTALILASGCAYGQQRRIAGRIDNAQRISLHGNINPRATSANDRGPVDPSLQLSYVTVELAQSASQKADLENLLAQQQDPASPNFRQWLTPQQYADRFGLSAADIAAVTQWLEGQGLTIAAVAQGRNWIAVSGPAAKIEAAFSTRIHRYVVNGETHFANATEPSVPAAIAGVVQSIRGLTDFRMKPRAMKPRFTSPHGNHYLAPNDIATIYNITPAYNAGIDGTGQKIVVAGQSDVPADDIQTFQRTFNLPANLPKMVLVGTNPGVVSGDRDESDLDIEWAGAVARNASIIFVYSQNVMDAVRYAIDQNLAPVISVSYGACEPETPQFQANAFQSWARQANLEGITWFDATGDNGAADCNDSQNPGLAVDAPASVPEVTGVGGTEFSENGGNFWNPFNDANGASALSYIPETAWNTSVADGSPAASGGGVSIYFGKPSWQVGPGVPADNFRHIPDISLASSPDHDGYLVYSDGNTSAQVYGGTSCATPVMAGIAVLLNQYLVSNGKQAAAGLGNINPKLYALAQSSPAVFHDITTGNNIVTAPVGYNAGPGYDNVTGLGSVDAWALMTSWSGGGSTPPPVTAKISGLTDAAAFHTTYSPGMIMSVFGTGLSPSAEVAGSLPLPVSLAGVTATVNGFAAPFYYASPGQLNIQVPYDTPVNTTATLQVNNNGQVTSQTFSVAPASPGIFTDRNSVIVPNGSAAAGQTTTLYITGAGAVTPPISTGFAPPASTPLNLLPAPQNTTVTVGGLPASTTCTYCFVGIPYGLAGVVQINFQVPAGLAPGLQPVIVTVNGVASPAAKIDITN